MLQMPKIHMYKNKEPWLAASLSWLLPGMGHFYSGAYGLGDSFIVLAGFIYIFWIASLISTWTLIIPTIILNLSGLIVLPVYASWNAYRITKKHNTNDFEKERTLRKDPWLAVFLSVVLPGSGHIYLRKWIVGTLFLLSLFVICFIFRAMKRDALLAVLVYRAFVSVHAYIVCQLHKVKLKQPLILFIIVLICLCFLKGFLLPQLEKRFFQFFGPLYGPSMIPTIAKGDRVIVNRFNYSFNNPKPGDIIVFTPPKYVFSDMIVPSCKRIIAVGGESIHIRDDIVYVDGQERKFGVQPNRDTSFDSSFSIDYFGESDNPYLTYGVDEPYSVPEGHYFVLGDNRHHSADSRWFGAIPRKNITGKVIKICWPPQRMGVVR